jgi:hypothetical protein
MVRLPLKTKGGSNTAFGVDYWSYYLRVLRCSVNSRRAYVVEFQGPCGVHLVGGVIRGGVVPLGSSHPRCHFIREPAATAPKQSVAPGEMHCTAKHSRAVRYVNVASCDPDTGAQMCLHV